MKILQKGITPDGINIQIEDWKENYSCFNTLTIGTYPIAKNSNSIWIKVGKTFRLDLNRLFNSDDEVYETFKNLEEGKVTLEELSKHFWNCEKDMYYLGMIDEY